jgi:HK97 family phage prohead protease
MKHKTYRGTATVKDATKGLAEVVVSAYGNVDLDGDIVVKGAVSKQIAGEYGPNPKGLLDHDWSMRSAVAKTIRMWEEDDGTHIEAQYNLAKEAGRDAFSDLAFYGADMEFSVGYEVKHTVPPTKDQQAAGARRVIDEWVINEWSHVMLGANNETGLVSMKDRRLRLDIDTSSATASLAELRDELRDGVLSVDEVRAAEGRAAKALVGSLEMQTEQLREALREAFPSEYLWVRGTFPDHVVFQREVRLEDESLETSTLDVPYESGEDGFSFGEPVEVELAEVINPKSKPPAIAELDEAAARRRRLELEHELIVATTRL